jgi:hypothetical protein
MPKPGNPSTMVLRLNQEICVPRLPVDGADHTQCHPTSQSSGHRVPNLCLIIPGLLHQVSYSCHDPCRCPPYQTCHLHTTRQANTILNTNNRVKQPKYLGFKFKPQQVNDSSQSNQDTDYLVSQSRTNDLCPRKLRYDYKF